MDSSLRDIILLHIDSALDVDDLENLGDYVRSVFTTESIPEWQVPDSLRQLHVELVREFNEEKNSVRRVRLKAAISYFEVDFTDYFIAREIETLRENI